jgi:hypothetical protein
MHRKILGICAALVALGALAIAPSMASAAATLQDTSGGVTTKVTGRVVADTDPGTVALFEGAFGKTECNENMFTAETIKNEPNGEFRGTITAAYFQSDLNASGTDCRSSLGELIVTIPSLTNFGGTKHWCIRTFPNSVNDEWELWGDGCGTEPGSGELTFVLDFTSGMTCSYKRAGGVKGKYTTTAATHGPATLTLEGEPEFKTDTSSSIFCPASGKLKVFKFNLYTDTSTEPNGWTVPFATGETADPVFVNPVE